ncbi:transcriptional regulator [Mucilaginibacter hurinus]|uniref:Transcriptional regulator n=1 Tax=Mucilaginibacter hurinus TaxID=2201324 RepID=A0A367GPD7_9SPHI|nr:GntR family transcriptional regulator [Mucilaginibacter hurinus]RCH55344.1 transcriptional regulator [Mucilaginibacter hurinus]
MKIATIVEHIHINRLAATPKYLQLCNSIINSIESGSIEANDTLPSINELSCKLEISRNTVEKAYRYLRKKGIIESVPSKGYFISPAACPRQRKILLLFNKLSPHKTILYDAFVEAIGDNNAVDLYVYNNDFTLFKKLIHEKKNDYAHYVIIPDLSHGEDDVYQTISNIKKDKIILLDKPVPGIHDEYSGVFQDFEADIYGALEKALVRIKKYHTIKIICSKRHCFPIDILRGFVKFCNQYQYNYKIVHDIDNEDISEGEVYIILMEDDLVTTIEKINRVKLVIGRQVGIISYNETPLKKLILKGITTISTDFYEMGRLAAGLVLGNSRERLQVPFYLRLRPSL